MNDVKDRLSGNNKMKKTSSTLVTAVLAVSFLIPLFLHSSQANANSAGPDAADALADQLQAAWFQGDGDTVRKKLDDLEALAAKTTDETLLARIHLLAGQGWRDYSVIGPDKIANLKTAISHLEKVVDLNPNEANAHALLANVYRRLIGAGQRDAEIIHAAIEHRQTAYQLEPTSPQVLLQEASALISIPADRGGDVEQGIAVGFEAIGRIELEDMADTSRLTAETWAIIGSGYRKMNRPELALRAYQNALKAQPKWLAIRDQVIPGLKSAN